VNLRVGELSISLLPLPSVGFSSPSRIGYAGRGPYRLFCDFPRSRPLWLKWLMSDFQDRVSLPLSRSFKMRTCPVLTTYGKRKPSFHRRENLFFLDPS